MHVCMCGLSTYKGMADCSRVKGVNASASGERLVAASAGPLCRSAHKGGPGGLSGGGGVERIAGARGVQ